MAKKQTKYHLWRKFSTKPYHRYACTVVQADTEDGFEIVEFDRKVADPYFLHEMANRMRHGVHTLRGGYDEEDKVRYDELAWLSPHDPGHFETAIRQIPNSVLGSRKNP